MTVRSKGIADPLEAWGQCLIQSAAYAKLHKVGLIRAIGYDYNGREHWAIFIDSGEPEWGDVIDLTARQFSTKIPARYETDVVTWLDDVCEWLGDSVWYEMYLSHNFQIDPFHRGAHIREDIDPLTYKREYAALKNLVKGK